MKRTTCDANDAFTARHCRVRNGLAVDGTVVKQLGAHGATELAVSNVNGNNMRVVILDAYARFLELFAQHLSVFGHARGQKPASGRSNDTQRCQRSGGQSRAHGGGEDKAWGKGPNAINQLGVAAHKSSSTANGFT